MIFRKGKKKISRKHYLPILDDSGDLFGGGGRAHWAAAAGTHLEHWTKQMKNWKMGPFIYSKWSEQKSFFCTKCVSKINHQLKTTHFGCILIDISFPSFLLFLILRKRLILVDFNQFDWHVNQIECPPVERLTCEKEFEIIRGLCVVVSEDGNKFEMGGLLETKFVSNS